MYIRLKICVVKGYLIFKYMFDNYLIDFFLEILSIFLSLLQNNHLNLCVCVLLIHNNYFVVQKRYLIVVFLIYDFQKVFTIKFKARYFINK